MISRFSRLLTVRLRPGRGELLCRLALPPARCLPDGLARELVVVASPTVPCLRRLTVYRRVTGAPEEPPRAA